jgi:hypothetical protein
MSNRSNISLQTLGFVSNTAKSIKPLGRDAHLLDLGSVIGNQTITKRNASVYDTLELMQSIILEDAPLVKKLAESLRGATLEATCNNVWRWVYQHVEYQLDTQFTEQVRKPLRCIKDALGDCDCMATLVGALLQALGIKFYIRMTAYRGAWQHVYIVVPKNQNKPSNTKRSEYYAMDCVLDAFDSEKKFSKKHDVFMDLAILNGVGEHLSQQQVNDLKQIAIRFQSTNPQISNKIRQFIALSSTNPVEANKLMRELSVEMGLGKTIVGKILQKTAETAKNVVQKAVDVVVDNNPLTLLARNGYLFMLQENINQQAVKLGWALMPKAEFLKYSDDGDYWERSLASYNKVKQMFTKLGGDKDSLDKNIKQGFNRGRKNGKIDQRIPELSGIYVVNGLGLEPTTSALISAGTAMFATAASLIDKKLDQNFALKSASISPPNYMSEQSIRDQERELEEARKQAEEARKAEEEKKSNTGLYVAVGLGVLAVGTGLYVATRPKKTKSSLSGTASKATAIKSKSKPKSTKPKAKSIKAKSNKKASTAQKSTIKKEVIKF